MWQRKPSGMAVPGGVLCRVDRGLKGYGIIGHTVSHHAVVPGVDEVAGLELLDQRIELISVEVKMVAPDIVVGARRGLVEQKIRGQRVIAHGAHPPAISCSGCQAA